MDVVCEAGVVTLRLPTGFPEGDHAATTAAKAAGEDPPGEGVQPDGLDAATTDQQRPGRSVLHAHQPDKYPSTDTVCNDCGLSTHCFGQREF